MRGLHRLVLVDVEQGTIRTPSLDVQSVEDLALCGERLCLIGTGMRDLDEIHSVDWDGNDANALEFNDWFEKRQRPRASLRRFEVPDGQDGTEEAEAWLLLPAEGEGHRDGPYPLLVDMHGWPHSIVLVGTHVPGDGAARSKASLGRCPSFHACCAAFAASCFVMATRTELLTDIERLDQPMPSPAGEGSRFVRSLEERAGRPASLAFAGGYARLVDGVPRMARWPGIAPDAPDR